MTKATINICVYRKAGKGDVYSIAGMYKRAREAITEGWDIARVIPVEIECDEIDVSDKAKRELAIKYAKLGNLRRQKEALEKEIRALAFELR